ncbi:MAG: alpha/beta fold hydrolase [Bacteroidota bacterium]|nr:alpha/beta fold hydrolase [Bacteroidota bacterium]
MKLFFRKYGNHGPRLIILHGLFGMSDNWRGFAKKLSAVCQIYIPDIRNHGNSPHSKEHNYKILAQDIKQFMSESEMKTAIILGHSMGGKTAMQLTADYPELVEKLIIVDIAPRAYLKPKLLLGTKTNQERFFEYLLKTENKLALFESRNKLNRHLEESFSTMINKYIIKKNIRRKAQGGYEFKFNPKNLYRQMDKIMAAPEILPGKFKKDVLFIKGEKSDYIQPADITVIRKLYPNAQINEIKGSGHMIHIDSPIQFPEVVSRFIENSEFKIRN